MMNERDYLDLGRYGLTPVSFDGEPWFVAADVCRALGLQNPKVVVSRLDDDEVMLWPHKTAGGVQKCLFVSEPGLYALLLASKKPAAKEFQRHIWRRVMPAVVTDGVYYAEMPGETEDELIARVEVMLRNKAERHRRENARAAQLA